MNVRLLEAKGPCSVSLSPSMSGGSVLLCSFAPYENPSDDVRALCGSQEDMDDLRLAIECPAYAKHKLGKNVHNYVYTRLRAFKKKFNTEAHTVPAIYFGYSGTTKKKADEGDETLAALNRATDVFTCAMCAKREVLRFTVRNCVVFGAGRHSL